MVRYDLFNHVWSYRNIMQFQISSRRENGKDSEPSRLDFLQKFSANNFALKDAEENTSEPLNKGGIAGLTLLGTLLAIRQKSREPSFWAVTNFFALLAYASLAASKTLKEFSRIFKNLLQELYFRFRTFILLIQRKKAISMNYDSNTNS